MQFFDDAEVVSAYNYMNPCRDIERHRRRRLSVSKPCYEEGLAPKPLFTNRTRIAPDAIRVAVIEIPSPSPTSNGSVSSSPSSAHSSLSRRSTSPTLTPGSSPPLSRSSSCSSRCSTISWATISWDEKPQRVLRRKPSPKQETLRSLRAKDSDASLQQIYEKQTLAYLDGMMFTASRAKSRLGMELGD